MNNSLFINKKRLYYIVLALITTLFIGTRLFRLDSVPFTAWGMELDELGAAYDAWCIQGGGVDRYLTKMPLMFLNTGDGQNALYIYMAALMFKIFGFSLVKFRLIAVICATAAFVCLYHLSKMIYGSEIYNIVPIALMTVMPVFITFAGLPATIQLGGVSFVTTAPAATTQWSPIDTPGSIIELTPITQFFPINVSNRLPQPSLPWQ